MPDKEPPEPFVDYDWKQNVLGRWVQTRLHFTPIGLRWLLFPYGLVFTKKLTYSILEFWIFVLFLSFAATIIAMTMNSRPILLNGVFLYLACHGCAMAFVAALYHGNQTHVPGDDTGRHGSVVRLVLLVLCSLFPLGLCCALSNVW